MNEMERKVYDTIVRYYLAQFLGLYRYVQRKIAILCEGEIFRTKTSQALSEGWKRAMDAQSHSDESHDNDDESKTPPLPKLKVGDAATALKTTQSSKHTKPPAYFTEGTLIAAMKNIAKFIDEQALKKTLRDTSGIGTEATRADIIEKLLSRNFIVRHKKQLRTTERGQALIELVPEAMKNPGTTALWEQALDDIAQGQGTLSNFLEQQKTNVQQMLEDLAELGRAKGQTIITDDYPCPKCKAPLARRQGKHGLFWGCTAYPTCKAVMHDDNGKPKEKITLTASDIDCPRCQKGKLVRRKAKTKGNYWWGCNQYPTCKGAYWDRSAKPDLTTPQRTDTA